MQKLSNLKNVSYKQKEEDCMEKKKCWHCKGTGRHTCYACGGSGVHVYPNRYIPILGYSLPHTQICTRCDGTGEVECEYCDGTGEKRE